MVRDLLGKAFPLMALSGLLLAGWGLISTPDELKHDHDVSWKWDRNAPEAEITEGPVMARNESSDP